jgi:hypothetical protein
MDMTTTWISPWNGNPVSVEELICEVALAAVSRMYVFAALGLDEPRVSVESDFILIKSDAIDYSYEISYPRDLAEKMERCFPQCMDSLRREYQLYVESAGTPRPYGEHLGEMLRRFETLERLLRLVAARHCWCGDSVLVLHGLRPNQFLASLRNELDCAGIHYVVAVPLNDEVGTGVFTAVPKEQAIQFIGDLRAERRGVVEKLLGLELEYGPHTWISNNDCWINGELMKAGGTR